MALLERDSSLAALAEYAAEARRGEGRLVLVAGEAGNAQIARELVLSPRTVDHHVSAVLAKLGAPTRAAASAEAARHGMVPAGTP